MSLLPNLDQMTDNEKLAVLESIQKSIAESKEIQKKKIGENVDLVVQALKKIEADIRDRFDAVGNTIEKRVASIKDGRDGANGTDGRDGKDGKSGRDGLKGDRGVDGQAGRDGVDGVDGVSVTNAHIDFDGSLVISLSDGRELNVGEVVSQDIAEKIKVISTMSTNAAIAIKDEGTTLTNGVKNINFVGAVVTATNSGDDVTVNVSSGTGTVTSVAATAGTGISVTGSPITTSGTLTITNTAPDQTVALTSGTGITTSGTYPNFTITNSAPDQTVALTAGTGINTSGIYPNFTITNSAPDQTVALTQGGTTTITGTYPNFTISSADQFQGTVTSVTGTSPVASSGGATPAISLAANYGDTQNPYASKTANFVLAAPNGSAGVPTFRAIVAVDIPTLNQNTTGSAATVTTTINSGVVATTQTAGDNSTKVATTAYVNAITGTNGITGFKNRIINGAMVIDQRNAGAEVNPAVTATYYLDRWVVISNAASKFKIGQNAGSVTPPAGFINYLGCTSLSAYTVGASESFNIQQRIEGLNVADLAWGTASASSVTLSFWVYSSLTGTFGGSLANSSDNRSYPYTYTISSANTWEQKTVTIAGDTSGTWLTTSGIGIRLRFSLGTGSTLSGTAGAWAGATYFSATGATSVVGTNGATFYVTGVQLEKGIATSFDYRPYGTELSLCQRYCPAWSVSGVSTNYPFAGQCYLTTAAIFTAPYPVQPRVAATGITTSGTFAVVPANYGTSAAGTVAIYGTGTNLSTFALNVTASSGLVAGNSTSLQSSSATSLIIGTGCEL